VHQGRGAVVRAIDFSLSPVRDERGAVALLIAEGRDITDLKRAQRAETAMLRALAAIGEQAAVLAHEIKNPVAAVNLALRAVAGQLGEDQKAVIEDLVARMQRLENVMRRTLTFAKPLELKPAAIVPAELIEQVVRNSRTEIVKRGAQVSTAVVPGTIAFEGDRQLLDEVLSNLLKNALEAVGERGQIEISARSSGEEVVLAIDDDGPGIADSVRATLFKPFVTTKSTGTGLGLAFCRKVIEEHRGVIEASRSERGGARFEVRLPVRLQRQTP
jgi:signal transduction histidine kinase